MLNTDTLYNYDVRRFFTQFGAHPNGVWSNPIGACPSPPAWMLCRSDNRVGCMGRHCSP